MSSTTHQRIVMGVVIMGNVPRAGIEPTSLAFQASVLTITLHKAPTCLCGSLPQRSVQTTTYSNYPPHPKPTVWGSDVVAASVERRLPVRKIGVVKLITYQNCTYRYLAWCLAWLGEHNDWLAQCLDNVTEWGIGSWHQVPPLPLTQHYVSVGECALL